MKRFLIAAIASAATLLSAAPAFAGSDTCSTVAAAELAQCVIDTSQSIGSQ